MTIAWKVLAAAAAAAALLSGCSSVSLDEGAKEGTLAGNQAAQQQTVQDPFTDPSNPLSHRSVYFAFDSYEVSPEYAAIVRQRPSSRSRLRVRPLPSLTTTPAGPFSSFAKP